MNRRSWRNSFEFIFYRAWAEFRSEASSAYLGFLWWFLEPLLYMGAFYFVFATGLRGRGVGYAPFLLCGLVGWKWFSSSLLRAARWTHSNRSIMQEIYVPKWMLVAVNLVNGFFKFLIVFALLLVFLLIIGRKPELTWLLSLAVVGVELILIAGSALLVAALVPFVPDSRLLLENGILLLFFLSGIFYQLDDVSPVARHWLEWNPLIHVFNSYRDVFLRGAQPDYFALAWVTLLGLSMAILGVVVLRRNDRRYPRLSR